MGRRAYRRGSGRIARVSDDLRLTVEFDDEAAARDLVNWLHEARLEAGDRKRVGDRVIVSRDDEVVYLYAGDETQAREVARLIQARAGHPAAVRVALDRWHPVEQTWEDAAVPLPQTEEEIEAERARLQAREAAESRASGHAEWEVRVELRDRESTDEFADRLEADGFDVVRRSTFVLVGAANEDEAHELADRLAAEAPEGARVAVEPSGQMVWEVAPSNPFAVFGGLGS
jgi:hypothetical protein